MFIGKNHKNTIAHQKHNTLLKIKITQHGLVLIEMWHLKYLTLIYTNEQAENTYMH